MNKQEVQKILRAWDECCELKTSILSDISTLADGWEERIEICCLQWNGNLDEIIDILEDWAAEYSATWNNYLCQEQDNEIISYDIVYTDYLCRQIDITTTTTSTTTTTTTTVDPSLEQWEIVYSDYLCQMGNDPSVTTTTTFEKSGKLATYSASWTDYLCEKEDNPLITTTTTTFSGTTTTSTTVDPEDVEFIATWTDFLCEMDDDPLQTTTTTTTTINEDDIEWQIVYSDYICQEEDDGVTTTTTSYVETTTTTSIVTTTTTTTSESCPVTESGNSEYGTEYKVNLGSATGLVTLTIDTIDVPDRFVVDWNGSEVIDTEYRGSSDYQTVLYNALILLGEPTALIQGAATGTFTFNKTSSDPIATVKVYAPISETEWSFTLSCCVADPLVTTTTTTIGAEFSAAWSEYLCEIEDDGITTTTTTSTTIPVTTTTTTISVNAINCNEQATGGEAFPMEVYVVTAGATLGYVTLNYDAEDLPDKFIVEIDGVPVVNTGYVGDSSLQSALDDALAARGLPSETISGTGSGSATFYKSSATSVVIVKVFAPIQETEWAFALTCPDGATTTTSTSTTSTTSTTTTTTVPVTTTTTTNAAPVSTNNSVANPRTTTCTDSVTLVPADFTFTDSDSDDLTHVRINSYSIDGSGTLTYNGSTVSDGQILTIFGGVSGSFQYSLVYTPDATETAFSDTIDFSVKTENNSTWG